MSRPSFWWWRTLVLSAVAVFVALSLAASGQGGKAGPTFAIVDSQRIVKDYKARERAESDLRAVNDRFMQRLARRDSMPFLTEAEHATLDQLSEKVSPADADKQKIDELTKKGQQQVADLQALRQKKELTADEKTRLADAEQALNKAQERLASMREELSTQFKDMDSKATDELRTQIRAAVTKVAEQKGVSIVFDSGVALYAGTDLTTPVLAELNKK